MNGSLIFCEGNVWKTICEFFKSSFIDHLILKETATVTLRAMLKSSKRFTNPTGGQLMDKIITDIPIFMNAVNNDDMETIHQMLNEARTFTHDKVRKVYAERIGTFKSLVTCISQGKCGYNAYIHYLCGCVNPVKTLLTSLSEWIICFVLINIIQNDLRFNFLGWFMQDKGGIV